MINITILCLLGVITILELIIIFKYKQDLAAIKAQLEYNGKEIISIKYDLDKVDLAKIMTELKRDIRLSRELKNYE